MSRPKLKLAKLTDNKPSKLSVSLPPDLLGDLEVYASIYEQTYGEKQAVGALIPSMLAGFLASDHGFKIDNVPRLHSSKFVFASSRTDGHYVGTPKVWSKVRKEAKIEDVRLHDLRHNFASIAASNGLSLPIIGALLGHTQPSTTARYAHLTESSLQQAAEMISSNLQSYKN